MASFYVGFQVRAFPQDQLVLEMERTKNFYRADIIVANALDYHSST